CKFVACLVRADAQRQESDQRPASHGMIVIVPYDPAWPRRFAAEALRIHKAFGVLALRIEHVRSPPVPGLAANPVVDIQVSAPSLDRPDFYRTLLAELGYTHFPLGAFDLVYPFFKRPA